MKKLIALLVTAAMFVSLGAPALAAANPPRRFRGLSGN